MEIKDVPYDKVITTQELINKYKNLSSLAQAKSFIKDLFNSLDLNYHPDDAFENYINNDNGERTFDDSQAEILNNINNRVIEIFDLENVDIYDYCFNLFKELNSEFFKENENLDLSEGDITSIIINEDFSTFKKDDILYYNKSVGKFILEGKYDWKINKEEFEELLSDLNTLDFEEDQVNIPKYKIENLHFFENEGPAYLYLLDRENLPESGPFLFIILDVNDNFMGFIRGTKSNSILSFNMIYLNEEIRGYGVGTGIYRLFLDNGFIIKSDSEITDYTWSVYTKLIEKYGYTPIVFEDGTVGILNDKDKSLSVTEVIELNKDLYNVVYNEDNIFTSERPNRMVSAQRSNGKFDWINYQRKIGDNTVSLRKLNVEPKIIEPELNNELELTLDENSIYKLKTNFNGFIKSKFVGYNNGKYIFESLNSIYPGTIVLAKEELQFVNEGYTNKYWIIVDPNSPYNGKILDYKSPEFNCHEYPAGSVKKIYFPAKRVEYYLNMFKRTNIKYANDNFFKSILNTLKIKGELSIKQLEELRFLIQNGKTKYEAGMLPNNY